MGRRKGSKNLTKSDNVKEEEDLEHKEECSKAFEQEVIESSVIEMYVQDGFTCKYIPCSYAQFSTKPIPAAKGQEPVWEFKLESRDKRYLVDHIFYTPHGLIFHSHDGMGIIPLANVAHVRIM